MRNVDFKRGAHVFIRVIRGCVFHHRDLVTKLSGVTNSRLDASVGDESDDDELMDAVLLELQIQVCVGEATRTPMFLGSDFAWSRLEFVPDFTAPGSEFKGFAAPSCLL